MLAYWYVLLSLVNGESMVVSLVSGVALVYLHFPRNFLIFFTIFIVDFPISSFELYTIQSNCCLVDAFIAIVGSKAKHSQLCLTKQ